MTAQKTEKPAPVPEPTQGRKPWVKKTPVETFLEQIAKQEERVTEMRKELAREEQTLAKFQQARKVLEAQ
jgi:hypothetical protein